MEYKFSCFTQAKDTQELGQCYFALCRSLDSTILYVKASVQPGLHHVIIDYMICAIAHGQVIAHDMYTLINEMPSCTQVL